MFEKFSRSWSLIKASASVLRSDKELLLFPLLSGICTLIVAASFLIPGILGGLFDRHSNELSPLAYLLMFAFYVVQYFVIIFFNSALVGAALIRLGGGDPTVADGFRIARSKLPAIIGYALISATVGMLLRMLQERAGWIGRWIIGLIGLAWTVATFLVVPVLVNQDVGPVDAVKKSASLLKQTWGENLVGNAGMGLVFGLIFVATILVGVGLITLAVTSKSIAVIVLAAALVGFALLSLVLIQSALQGIYAAALYRYAKEGDAGTGFDAALIGDAFKVKA